MKEQDHDNLLIDCPTAEKVLLDRYRIKGRASSLPGEYDMNFRIQTDEREQFILKISGPDTDPDILDFQQSLLSHLETYSKDVMAPRILSDHSSRQVSSYTDSSGRERFLRLLTWIPGRMYHEVHPKRHALRLSLGTNCGRLSKALLGFDHPAAHRTFEWDLANSLWTREHLELFTGQEKELVGYFQHRFSKLQDGYANLRKSVIHNDANDHNLIVSSDLKDPAVIALIDYGDAIFSQTINDLAVACAYGIMDQHDPLDAAISIVKGYHSELPLLEEELPYLYDCIAMRLVITVTKAALNKRTDPDNDYLQVSDVPAWELLKKWNATSGDFAHFAFRTACRLPSHPQSDKIRAWGLRNKFTLSQLFPSANTNDCLQIDLSVGSKWLGHLSKFADFELFEFKINKLRQQHPGKIICGGYLEPRLVYTTEAYMKTGNERPESRTIHLGIDFWLPAETPVHSVLRGEVVVAINDEGDKEYGGLVILKHQEDGISFYSLYGHLSVASALALQKGQILEAGDRIGSLGHYPENGNWPPHLHFELMLSLLDYTKDFPGVAYKNELEIWKGICPDPNILFGLPNLKEYEPVLDETLMDFREIHLGKGLSLAYDQPLQIVRGMGAWLIDQYGSTYLDTVNNVAHVGHEHPRVVQAGQDQMAMLNTNTRYLHKNIMELTGELLNTLPPELSVVHFVNSGSEANELALRMAKAATGNTDILASEMGYHGNTNACVEVSSYKFDGKGGDGCPEHTHLFPIPDSFRGRFRGKDTGEAYAKEVEKKIAALQRKGRAPAALIIEPIISCGGQIELPQGFLSRACDMTRKAGGLLISDEVQVGCGRMGSVFWGFQLHGVVPDIITIGKPLGNGHPVAAVVCSRAVADKFANGMEYFNTFGGNPVSCAIATAVLKCVRAEGLQENALKVGKFLKSELQKLSREFSILRDIRGQGLFLGVELTDQDLNPLPGQTKYLVSRMKDKGILMSSDGPDHNVLKIKPPLVFSKENAVKLIGALKEVLSEDSMRTINNLP